MEKKEKSFLFSEILTVPNIITTARIVCSFLLMKQIILHGLMPMTLFGITSPWILPLCAAGIALTDTLDGMIARKFHASSELGVMLDGIADKCLNWGIVLSVVLSKVMPLSALLLLVPTLGRDFYVALQSAYDKYVDGKETVTKNIGDEEKKQKFSDKVSTMMKGKGVQPTIYGKIKMWGMSLAMILGLRYGFVSLTFTSLALVTDALSIADVFAFQKKLKKVRDDRIAKKPTTDISMEVDTTDEMVKEKEKAEEAGPVHIDHPEIERMLDTMMKDPTYHQDAPLAEKHAVYTKKYEKH